METFQKFREFTADKYLKFRRALGPHNISVKQLRINGYEMLVRVEEDVGSQIRYLGKFEEAETNFLARVIGESDTCFDIGAHLGYYTLLLATLARKGKVYSFEPVPLNFYLLQGSIHINGFDNVVANRTAVGDEDGTREFSLSEDTAYSSFVDTGRIPSKTTFVVPVTTISSYCREHGVDRIGFMKVDVEGAEGLVISGAGQIMADPSLRPKLLMLELYEPMLERYGACIDSITRTMAAWEFKPFVCDRGRLVPYENQHYNVFFVSDLSFVDGTEGRKVCL